MRFTVHRIMIRRTLSLILSICVLFALTLSTTSISFASDGNDFSDIKNHWAEGIIRKWVSLDLIKGYGNGRFGPNDSISRAEFVTILNRIFCHTQKSNSNFPDVKSSA